MKTILSIAGALLALGLAFALGVWSSRPEPLSSSPTAAQAGTEREVLYWYDPMVPDTHFDAPGRSPFMDMELVPKYAEANADAGAQTTSVQIEPEMQQNLGVRTAAVEHGRLPATLQVPGTVAWDARETYQLSARAAGVIERVHVRAPFEPVRAGEPLVELVSPEWNAAIAEFRALADAGSADARALRSAARQRLRALGIGDAQLRDPGAGAAVVLRAPADGVLAQVQVREGEQVAAGAPLMTINGLDTVWVEAALPQSQAAAIAPGDAVEVTAGAVPGVRFRGTVETLLPSVDPTTRTQAARIVLANPQHRLVPGMFVEVALSGAAAAALPLVPDEALIATGEEARVIVAEGAGRFRPQRVRTGRSSGGLTQILAGLEGGEQVVVSGQFLIDSEASLSGLLQRLPPASEADAPRPDAREDAANPDAEPRQ